MSAHRQSDSDPLPYVQVDRAVKPRAALLAGALGVTTQHALGSLVEWWDLNGDPRELERIVEATPDGATPAVVVTREDAALRFRLASGKDVEPVTLVHLGLLEPVGEGFRVRGMSRYFAPVEARIRARRAASVGGKASAESRRKSVGTAQPRSAARSESASESAQATVEATPEATPKRARSGAEAESNPIGQRSAVSGQLQEQQGAPLFADAVAPEPKRSRPAQAKPSDELCADFEAVTGQKYLWQGAKDGTALAALLKAFPLEEVRARWRRGLEAPSTAWASCRNVATLRAKWNDLGDARPGRGPIPAESVDWTQQQTGEVPL